MKTASQNRRSNSRFYFESHKNLLKSNRSQAHVEMIVSFALFLGFLITLLFILNPIGKDKNLITTLEVTQGKIMKNISADYISASLIVDAGVAQGTCFYVANKPGLAGNVLAEDLAGNMLPASSTPDSVFLASSPNNRFYKLYFSEGFENANTFSCGNQLPGENYDFGATEKGNLIVIKKVQRLIAAYNDNYDAVRNNLGLKNNFALFFYDTQKNLLLNASRFVPSGAEVSSRNINTKAMDVNGHIFDVVINLRTW